MKTQQAQEIFDVLVTELINANDWNLMFVARTLVKTSEDLSPPDYFVTSVKQQLKEGEINEEFLRKVYKEAFHIGLIPKNRNHIAMTCDLQVNKEDKSPVLNFWVDLDRVAAQLNTYLQINSPYRFKIKYDSPTPLRTYFSSGDTELTKSTSYMINSVHTPSSIYTNFLFCSILSGIVSGNALLIATLAVASIITLSTTGIVIAAGVGLVAGVASYRFFKARSGVNTTIAPIEESSSEDIETIFKDHFAKTISTTTQDRFETIEDEQPSVITA